MKWPFVSSAGWIRQRSFAVRGFYQNCRRLLGADLVTVPITSPKPTPSLPPHVEYRQAMHEGVLMARRQALIVTIRKLRRDHKATRSARADLQAVTLEILAMGERC